MIKKYLLYKLGDESEPNLTSWVLITLVCGILGAALAGWLWLLLSHPGWGLGVTAVLVLIAFYRDYNKLKHRL